jgi:hypothetical protein
VRIGKSRLNLTASIRLSKNIFFGDGISGALAGRGIFGTTSQALAISPQFAQGAATFGTTSAAQLPYLAQGANTFGLDHSATLSSFTGLLDEYPGAAAAYSVRLLSSTYSGPLVRIRKDTGGNPEKDFYPDSNNELSLNSGDGGGTTLGSWIGSNDGYIVTWYDQSGNSNDTAQSTASSQPQILSLGSLITMGGASKAAIQGSTSSLVLSTALTPTNFSLIHTSEGSGFLANISNYIRISTYYRYDISGTSYISVDANATQQSLYVGNRNGTNLNLRRNGSEMDSSPFTSVTNALNITSIFNRSGAYFAGKISEFIIYESNQSSNISGIETNINDYFNIYP